MVPVGGRGHNRENHIHVFILKKIFRTSRQISIKLGTNNPWVKAILNCSNKGPVPLQMGDSQKKWQKFGRVK
jgi:hypothetical protein